MADQNDPFEEETTGSSETEVTKEAAETEEAKPDAKAEGEADESKAGEKEESTEPPSEDDKDKGGQSEKMIPESRFKAALKDVTDRLDAANQKLAKTEAVPIPDKTTDPDGYDLHLRMETSKAVMRETVADYDDVIRHYQEMAKENPYLNEAVAKHPAPAKYAYDLAKKSLEIKELSELKKTDEWKEFQEFKKNKGAKDKEAEADAGGKIGKKLAEGAAKVPNLNRATNVANSNSKSRSDDGDELFAGAL